LETVVATVELGVAEDRLDHALAVGAGLLEAALDVARASRVAPYDANGRIAAVSEKPKAPSRERRPVELRLPNPEIAPNFRNAVTGMAGFDVTFGHETATVHRGPRLAGVQAHRLTADGESQERMWRVLAAHPARSFESRHRQRALEEAATRTESGTVEGILGGLTLTLMVTPPDELRGYLEPELPRLWGHFPDMTLWLASVADQLISRLSLVRLLFQMHVTPELPLGDGAVHQRSLAAQSLSNGVSFADAIQPAFLIFSPAATGFATPVMPHALVLEFGAVIDLRPETSPYRTRVLEPKASMTGRRAWVNEIPKEHLGSLLAWWVDRISRLYDIATDPTRFAAPDGTHDVMGQMAFLLTAERAVADLTELNATPKGAAVVRLGLAFNLLDKLETLLGYGLQSRKRYGQEWSSGRGFTALLDRRRCLPMMQRNFGHLPLQLRGLFVGRAQALFDEFEVELAGGVLKTRLRDGAVMTGRDADASMPLSTYAGNVVRAVRNSSHGLLDQLAGPDPGIATTHTGELPAALPELVALIALAVFADPERLWRIDVLGSVEGPTT
jgi:hypothetical protein